MRGRYACGDAFSHSPSTSPGGGRMNRGHAKSGWLGLALAALGGAAALAVVFVAPAGSAGQTTSNDTGWQYVDNTLDGQRYSPLNQIDRSNVKGLKVAW